MSQRAAATSNSALSVVRTNENGYAHEHIELQLARAHRNGRPFGRCRVERRVVGGFEPGGAHGKVVVSRQQKLYAPVTAVIGFRTIDDAGFVRGHDFSIQIKRPVGSYVPSSG